MFVLKYSGIQNISIKRQTRNFTKDITLHRYAKECV